MPPRTATGLAGSLRLLNAHLQRRVAAALAGVGVSQEEWWVLEDLVARPGRPMSAISTSLVLPPPTLTKIVDRLVDQNHVHRRGDPADRRRVLLHPTERGRDRAAELGVLVAATERELAALLGPDVTDRLEADLAAALDSESFL